MRYEFQKASLARVKRVLLGNSYWIHPQPKPEPVHQPLLVLPSKALCGAKLSEICDEPRAHGARPHSVGVSDIEVAAAP